MKSTPSEFTANEVSSFNVFNGSGTTVLHCLKNCQLKKERIEILMMISFRDKVRSQK